VLTPGGAARGKISPKWSFVGFRLWIRYALLRLRPWMTLTEIYSRYLESPGTKAYTVREAKEMFAKFRSVDICTVLTHGDLLESAAGQRHGGAMLAIARRIWPSGLIRRLAPTRGLFMLITATK